MSSYANIPFRNQGIRNVIREGQVATLEDLIVTNDLSVNGVLTYHQAEVISDKTINGDLRVYGDTSLNVLYVNSDTSLNSLYANEGEIDDKLRVRQLEVKIQSNDDTYMNFRENSGDANANDIATFKSGIDSGEFPSAHFIDVSFAGDYSSNPTEIFLSTDKTKNSYIDNKSKFGINTRTPRLTLDVSGDTYSNVGVFGYDGNLVIDTIETQYGYETVTLQTYIDDNGIDDRGNFPGANNRYKLCLQPEAGLVGIRTDNPSAVLHVVNDFDGNGDGLDYLFFPTQLLIKNDPDTISGRLEKRRITAYSTGGNITYKLLCNLGTGNSQDTDLFDGNMSRVVSAQVENTDYKGQRWLVRHPDIDDTDSSEQSFMLRAFGNTSTTQTGLLEFFYNGDMDINGTFGTPSDERYKENIVDANLTSLISDFQKIRFVNFNMKDDTAKIKKLGVLAQEIREIYPSCVVERSVRNDDDEVIDKRLSVKYEVLYLKSCLLVQHLLKENERIVEENEDLKVRVSNLENKVKENEELKTRISGLESQVSINNSMLLTLTNSVNNTQNI